MKTFVTQTEMKEYEVEAGNYTINPDTFELKKLTGKLEGRIDVAMEWLTEFIAQELNYNGWDVNPAMRGVMVLCMYIITYNSLSFRHVLEVANIIKNSGNYIALHKYAETLILIA